MMHTCPLHGGHALSLDISADATIWRCTWRITVEDGVGNISTTHHCTWFHWEPTEHATSCSDSGTLP